MILLRESARARMFYGHNCNRFNHIYAPAVQNITGKSVTFAHATYVGDAITLTTSKPAQNDFNFLIAKVGSKKHVLFRGNGILQVKEGSLHSQSNMTLKADIDVRKRIP